MATPAAVLSILVDANTGAANANLAKTDAQLRGTAAAATATSTSSQKAGTAMKKLGTVAKWAGLAVAAGFVIEAKKAVTTTQDLTKSTISLHKNLGLTNKTASEWAGVAKARGADTTKLGMAFKTLATQISAAGHGSDAAQAIFTELGFSQKDVQKSMTDTQFAIGKVADGLNALPAGADKAAFSGKLFGRGWQTIAPILRDGSAAMQEQLDTVEKYGGVLEGKTLGAQKRLLANIRENKIAWQGFQVTLASAVTPALNVISTQFQKIAAINADKDLTGEEKWSKIAVILERDFRKALNVFTEMIPIIAEHVGQAAPQIAVALVKGFLSADIWGKLAIGGFLISKMGGWAAIAGIGKKIGARVGIGIAAGEAGGIAAGGAGAAGAAGAGGAAAGISAGGIAAIGVAGVAAGVGVHKLMEAFGDYLDKKDAVERGTEVIAGQYGNLGKVAQRLGKQIRSTGDISERVWSKGTGTLKEAATAEVQLIVGLKNHYGSFAIAARHLSKDQRSAWIDMAQSARDSGDITQRQLMKLTNAFSDVGKKNRKMWRDAAQVTGESTKDIKKFAGDMTVTVSKDYQGMVKATGHGMEILTSNTSRALKAMGVTQEIKFAASPAATAGVGGVHGGGHRRQRGGMIPGQGDGDKVHVMAEPGEGFINKTAVKKMGGPKAIDAINKAAPRFQKGGVAGMSAMIGEANKFEAKHFPYSWGGGHGSFGIQPVDCSGAVSDVLHAAGLLNAPMTSGSLMNWGKAGKGALTVYANPEHVVMSLNGRVFGTSGSNPGGGAGWIDGARGESLAPGAVRTMDVKGGVMGDLKRVILKGPKGALTSMGQGALDKTWKAGKALIAKKTPAGAFGGGQASIYKGDLDKVFPHPGGPTIAAWQAAMLAEKAGLPGITYAQIAKGESTLRPGAVSDDGGYGLWQMTPRVQSAQTVNAWNKIGSYFNPWDNARMAKYLAGGGTGVSNYFGTGFVTGGIKHWHGEKNFAEGGVVGPYVGSFAKGGEVAETGLAHVHKGETVVPGFKRGGTVGLHATPHHGFIASHQFDARGLAAAMKVLQRQIKRLGNATLSKREGRELHRLEGRRHLTLDQVARRDELQKQRHTEKERKRLEDRIETLEAQRANDKEMITEFKALRTDLKEHNRLAKLVRLNEKGALQAVVNLTASQIGAQGMVKGRNASPGRAARY